MPDILPGYRWDPASARYRSNSTGRYVARGRIVELLDESIQETQTRMVALTTAFHEGRIAPAVWVEQMSTNLKRLHLQNRALGAGGWDRLTQADYGAVGGRLRAEYQRLGDFAVAIQNGDSSIAQSLNRVNMYAGTARRQYWQAHEARQIAAPGMVTIEKRNLGHAEHCSDCVEYYNRGWQMLGTLPEPGDESQCMSNCQCTKEYRQVRVEEAQNFIGRR